MTKKATKSTARKQPAAKASHSKRQDAEKLAAERAQSREKQEKAFEQGMALFHSGKFAEALKMLQQAVDGPNREMAHAAKVHLSVCEKRTSSGEVKLSTPDEHYDYAVTLINQRRLEQALEHLNKALDGLEDADHVHYALAICLGLMGDVDGAAHHLGRAVAIAPRNRTVARNDPDFQSFASAPAIKKVLHPEPAE